MKYKLWVTVVLFVALESRAGLGAEPVSVLLEKGIYTEETVGDLDGAIKIYEQIISEAKANRSYIAQAYYRLGRCYLKKGQDEDAIAAFEELLSKFPEQTELVAEARKHLPNQMKLKSEELSSKGWRLWQARELEEAEKMFQQAVELDPGNANAWNGLGWSQFNQGKSQAAKIAFEKCLEVEPKHAAALNGLGWIAKAQGKTEKAIDYWKKAIEAFPGTTASLSGLTETYLELEQYEEAIKK